MPLPTTTTLAPILRRVASICCLPQELIDEITDIACELDLSFVRVLNHVHPLFLHRARQKQFASIFVAATHSDDKRSLGQVASFLEDNPDLLALPKSVTFALGGLLDLAPIAHVLPRLIHISRWHFCFTSINPPPLMPLSHICMLVTEVEFEGDLHINMLSMILPVLPSLRSLELQGADRSFNLAATHSNFTFPPTFHDLLSWVILPSLGKRMGTLWATVTTLSSVHACAVSDDAVQGIQGCVDGSVPTLLQFKVRTGWPSWSPSKWVRPFDLHRCTHLRYFKIETYATGGLEACVATITTLNSTALESMHLELHVQSDFLRQEPYYQRLLPRLDQEISRLLPGGTRISIDLVLVRIELQDAYIDQLREYAWQYLVYLPRVRAVAKINLYWNQWMSEVNPHSLLPEGSEPNSEYCGGIHLVDM
ncbi:hypothetical protein IW261DRAFT_1575099 [Armillaria novae-zelandiae]|uniref:Uncharacterized protein n=1 Tax=Armillaria novae-zelandiae TaxID=153914 RepID=A0AA39TSB4_9AGAR|nr:hypothetical protein IW261DRAFT_1575099 [Armillaria novae-zelandiae]